MTEEEYVRSLSHSTRFEFTDGVVTAKRGPYMTQVRHVATATELRLLLVPYARRMGGFAGQTPTSNLSSGERRLYRIPDLAYWAPGRSKGDGIFTPPTLAVEIVSPDQNVSQLREKCRLYRSSGVDVVWLVHPEQCRIEVWEDLRSGERYERGSVVVSGRLPGLSLDTGALFDAVDADAT